MKCELTCSTSSSHSSHAAHSVTTKLHSTSTTTKEHLENIIWIHSMTTSHSILNFFYICSLIISCSFISIRQNGICFSYIFEYMFSLLLRLFICVRVLIRVPNKCLFSVSFLYFIICSSFLDIKDFVIIFTLRFF